jgi:ribonuclease HII
LRVAGADEAGRGSLFGPIFAAAVILDPARPIRGLRDSKQLSEAERERLAAEIRERALAWAVSSVDACVIDEINILEASRLAMKQALEALPTKPDFVLLDAVSLELPIPQRPLVRGDARCWCIAAASILAKVARDAAMREWDRVYPGYGLARHKGYPAPSISELWSVGGQHLITASATGQSGRPVRSPCACRPRSNSACPCLQETCLEPVRSRPSGVLRTGRSGAA